MVENSKIQLYHFKRCPYCEKTRRTLRALHLDYESHLIDPKDRTEVKRVSGQKEVPVIAEGETVVHDSTEIFKYLNAYHGNGFPIIPSRDQADGLAQIFNRYADAVWGPMYYQALKEIDDNGDPLDTAGKKALQDSIDKECGVLDMSLHGRNFLVGTTLTIADIAVSAFLNRLLEMTRFTIDESYRHLWDWYNRVEARIGPRKDEAIFN